MGTGVNFAEKIGIDLSIKRQYSNSQRIVYHVAGTRAKRLCGNADYPSIAMRKRGRCGLGLLLAALLGTTSVAGCSSDGNSRSEQPTGTERVVYADGGGPLGGSPGLPGDSGGVSVLPPEQGADHWYATFGAMLLCSRTGADIRIEKVSASFSGKPVPVTFLVRKVNTGAPGKDGPSPVTSMKGQPQQAGIEGTFVRPERFSTSASCHTSMSRFDELMMTMHVGRAGAETTKLLVDYTVDDTPSQLVIPWLFAACGDQVKNHDLC